MLGGECECGVVSISLGLRCQKRERQWYPRLLQDRALWTLALCGSCQHLPIWPPPACCGMGSTRDTPPSPPLAVRCVCVCVCVCVYMLSRFCFSAKLTVSTLTFFSPYTDSPGTMLRVTSASSLPRAMNTPVNTRGPRHRNFEWQQENNTSICISITIEILVQLRKLLSLLAHEIRTP